MTYLVILSLLTSHGPRARYVKLRVVHALGMLGTFSPPPWISDLGMHHGTCVTHVPWCMPGSLTNGFLWSQWRGNVPGIPGACASRNSTYLVRGPLLWMGYDKVILLGNIFKISPSECISVIMWRHMDTENMAIFCVVYTYIGCAFQCLLYWLVSLFRIQMVSLYRDKSQLLRTATFRYSYAVENESKKFIQWNPQVTWVLGHQHNNTRMSVSAWQR